MTERTALLCLVVMFGIVAAIIAANEVATLVETAVAIRDLWGLR